MRAWRVCMVCHLGVLGLAVCSILKTLVYLFRSLGGCRILFYVLIRPLRSCSGLSSHFSKAARVIAVEVVDATRPRRASPCPTSPFYQDALFRADVSGVFRQGGGCSEPWPCRDAY